MRPPSDSSRRTRHFQEEARNKGLQTIVVRQSSSSALFERQPRIIEQVDATVDRGEVLRYLGYPAGVSPNARLQDILERWIEEAGAVVTPRAIYVVLPVAEKDHRRLRLQAGGRVVEFHGAIGEFLGAAQSVAAFIATAGPEVVQLASELLRQQDELAAMVVNAIGAERAEAAETAVIDQLRLQAEPSGFAPTLPYSPGYCGMSLTEQTKLFSLFGRENIGVTLSAECLMTPLKSVSGLIGLGPADQVEQFGTPCDRCELHNCAMRR